MKKNKFFKSTLMMLVLLGLISFGCQMEEPSLVDKTAVSESTDAVDDHDHDLADFGGEFIPVECEESMSSRYAASYGPYNSSLPSGQKGYVVRLHIADHEWAGSTERICIFLHFVKLDGTRDGKYYFGLQDQGDITFKNNSDVVTLAFPESSDLGYVYGVTPHIHSSQSGTPPSVGFGLDKIEVLDYWHNDISYPPRYWDPSEYDFSFVWLNASNDSETRTSYIRDYLIGGFVDTVSQGKWHYYKAYTPGGSLTAILDQLTGDVDLYIMKDSLPNLYGYGIKSYMGGLTNENATLNAGAGYYWIGVYGKNAGNYHLRLSSGDVSQIYKP